MCLPVFTTLQKLTGVHQVAIKDNYEELLVATRIYNPDKNFRCSQKLQVSITAV